MKYSETCVFGEGRVRCTCTELNSSAIIDPVDTDLCKHSRQGQADRMSLHLKDQYMNINIYKEYI